MYVPSDDSISRKLIYGALQMKTLRMVLIATVQATDFYVSILQRKGCGFPCIRMDMNTHRFTYYIAAFCCHGYGHVITEGTYCYITDSY